MKERFNKKILTNLARFKVTRTQLIKADEDKANAPSGVSGKGVTETGSSRRPYSRYDDEAILKHLVKNQEYARVAGRDLWVEMEGLGVVSGRSWQSLKDHFRRSIMGNIRSFCFLSKEQRFSLEARGIVEEEDVRKVEGEEEVQEVDEVGEHDWTLEEACTEGWDLEEEVEEVHVSYILVDF